MQLSTSFIDNDLFTVDWKGLSSPTMGMNCLGRLLRDNGHSLEPSPPERITGIISTPLLVMLVLPVRRDENRIIDFDTDARVDPDQQILVYD
jgi:hypothetical protein